MAFNGSSLGLMTGWRCVPGTAQFEDATNVTSQVFGVGTNARVLREVHCVAIEPGSADLTLFGCPPYATSDIGKQGVLNIQFENGWLSLDAYLESFDVAASVGEFLQGTARFRISGQTGN